MRRSVSKNKSPWVGWRNDLGIGLLDLQDLAKEKDSEASARQGIEIHERELYLTTLFCVGVRGAEAIELLPEKFYWNPDLIVGHNTPVLKYYDFPRDNEGKKIPNPNRLKRSDNKFLTEQDTEFRDAQIPRKLNKLADRLIDFIEEAKVKKHRFLLPRRKNFNSEIIPNLPTSTRNVYTKICDIHPDIWPHWLRSQHVSFLIDEVGIESPYIIKDLMHWSSIEMAVPYYDVSEKKRRGTWGIEKMPRPGERRS